MPLVREELLPWLYASMQSLLLDNNLSWTPRELIMIMGGRSKLARFLDPKKYYLGLFTSFKNAHSQYNRKLQNWPYEIQPVRW